MTRFTPRCLRTSEKIVVPELIRNYAKRFSVGCDRANADQLDTKRTKTNSSSFTTASFSNEQAVRAIVIVVIQRGRKVCDSNVSQ